MAYALLVERLERSAMLSQVGALIAATAGQRVEAVDPATARERFDEWLISPLGRQGTPRNRQQWELEAALGIGA